VLVLVEKRETRYRVQWYNSLSDATTPQSQPDHPQLSLLHTASLSAPVLQRVVVLVEKRETRYHMQWY
jgi:hypothetical protein